MSAFQEPIKPLLRHNQITEYKEEISRVEGMLNAPPYIAAQIQDIGEARRQLRALKHDLETQSPKPYDETVLDDAVRRERELREQWMQGMPTQAEMRRNPAGARDKHIRWERANKARILEWKNIRLRLHETGMLGEIPDASDVANVERFRPQDASHELNMHNEQIPGKTQFGPYPGAGPAVVLSDTESKTLEALDPELHSRMALLSNDQRRQVLEILREVTTPVEEKPKTEMQMLREEARALGISLFQKGKETLREEIRKAKES